MLHAEVFLACNMEKLGMGPGNEKGQRPCIYTRKTASCAMQHASSRVEGNYP